MRIEGGQRWVGRQQLKHCPPSGYLAHAERVVDCPDEGEVLARVNGPAQMAVVVGTLDRQQPEQIWMFVDVWRNVFALVGLLRLTCGALERCAGDDLGVEPAGVRPTQHVTTVVHWRR